MDSQKLSGELEQAGREVTSSLDSLSASTRQRLTAGLSTRLKDEQAQLRTTLEKSLKDSANDMAQLLASVAPRAMWDSDIPTLSEFARRAQRNPNVLFVIYDDASGEHLTRYLNRENPINKALLEKGKGERALDKVLDAAKSDPSVYYLEASISPNGVEIGKVLMGVSTASVEADLKALDQRFLALIASSDQLVGDSLKGRRPTAPPPCAVVWSRPRPPPHRCRPIPLALCRKPQAPCAGASAWAWRWWASACWCCWPWCWGVGWSIA